MMPTLLYSIIYSLVAFPLTHKYVTLNGHFTLSFCASMTSMSAGSECQASELQSAALTPGIRSLATLKLVCRRTLNRNE